MLRAIPAMILLALCACANLQPVSAPPSDARSTYLDDALQHQGVIIGRQPQPIDMAALSAAGVVEVFNLRTSAEIEGLDFDPATQWQALGIGYQHQPIGGEAHPYTPAVLDAFSAMMSRSQGPVLLHCASGGRAAQVYAAWLVRERGYSPDAALREMGSQAGWPLPLERLLDRPLRVGFADGEG